MYSQDLTYLLIDHEVVFKTFSSSENMHRFLHTYGACLSDTPTTWVEHTKCQSALFRNTWVFEDLTG